MKNNFLMHALSLLLLCLVTNIVAMSDNDKEQARKDRETQKMIAVMAGSALAYGATHYLADKWGFAEAGHFLNISRKAIRAGFGLSGTLAGLSIISDKVWSERFRSAALRVWLMPLVGVDRYPS